MQTIAIGMMLTFVIAAILASWFYFRRFSLNRPPIGVINLYDIALMIAGIIVTPYLYLWIPLWLVVGLLTLGTLGLLPFGFEPLLHKFTGRSWLVWLLTLVLIVADMGAAYLWTTSSRPFLLVNNVVMFLSVITITNLWAQSGLKARDVTLLGVALIVYDLIATAYLPLMGDLFQRMMRLPLGTQFAWALDINGDINGVAGAGALVAIGIGDVLLAAVFPLIMRRAFGVWAGRLALICSITTLVGLPLLPLTTIFPVMIVLGPVMLLQYLAWRYWRGSERTTWRYLQAEPFLW